MQSLFLQIISADSKRDIYMDKKPVVQKPWQFDLEEYIRQGEAGRGVKNRGGRPGGGQNRFIPFVKEIPQPRQFSL